MKKNTLSGNRGFTLVEVLVAVVVLSIGLLAVAGMQTTSLRGGNSALYRTQATLGCEFIVDSMRANRANALSGDYDIALGEDVTSTTSVALTDLGDWKKSLDSNLPSGDGSVVTNGDTTTIVVQWSDTFGQDRVEVVTNL